jgi:DNA-binding GntR family transcriptional regulator
VSRSKRPVEERSSVVRAEVDESRVEGVSSRRRRSARVPGPVAESGGRRSVSESDRVYELLRGDLVAGLFAPGEPLVEEVLAKHYETSRTPIRAAMLRLVWDRLLESRPHAPTIVREITPRDIRQIYEMRQAVESFAVETAIGRIDREQLQHLMAMHAAPQAGDALGTAPEGMFHQGVTPLHRLIVESMGNARLTDVLCTQSLPIARTQALYWRMANPWVDELDERRRAQALIEHQEIVQALLDGDAPTARTALLAHLQRGGAHLVELMTSVDLEQPQSAEAKHRISQLLPNVLDHMIPGVPEQGEGPL